jgi:hypothetical protein
MIAYIRRTVIRRLLESKKPPIGGFSYLISATVSTTEEHDEAKQLH